MANNNSITYRQVGDFLIPNLTLPPKEATIRLGNWGMMHKNYLIKHKKVQFNIMLIKGTLWTCLADVDKQAGEMFDMLVEQMKVSEGVTEELKKQNQMDWVQRMCDIHARAREIVYSDLIYK